MTNDKFKPEEKAAWKLKQGSRFVRVIPARAYSPEPKPPSKRDKHRMEVADRKRSA